MPSILLKRGRPLVVAGMPSFARPDSQLVTASQIYEPEFATWAHHYGGQVLDRKVWEYSYIAQALHSYVDMSVPKRGLVFGAGLEKLPAVLAKAGHTIVATDLPDQDRDWQSKSLNDLHHPEIIDLETLSERVSFRAVDMNRIPDDLTGFDFLWSTGSLEHIGSYNAGLEFVERAMDCLNPGGIAVHTTEFTITSEIIGQHTDGLNFYCRRDIEDLALRLTESGHFIALNFTRGDTVADLHVDTPPYRYGMTLTAHFHAHVITSLGLIIQRRS